MFIKSTLTSKRGDIMVGRQIVRQQSKVRKQSKNTSSIGIVVAIIVILVVSLAYFMSSNNLNIKKSDIQEENRIVEERPVEERQVGETQLVITNGVYSNSKGTLVIDVWNKGKKEAELERISFVSGPVTNMEAAIEEFPSKAIGSVLKPDERESFTIELSELPDNIWAVPASHNPVDVGILSKEYIQIEE